MKPLIPIAIISFLTVSSFLNASIASDNASNYLTWTDSSNLGTGFNPWDLSNNNGSLTDVNAGYFLGDSTNGTGDLNTGGTSFGMFANDTNPTETAFADAIRGFSSPLNLGEIFSIDLGVNFRNGNKGLNINDNSLNQLFNFNVGSDDYQVNSNSLGLAYASDSVFTLSFEQKTGTTIGVNITRQSTDFGNESAFSQDIDFGATMDNFKLYISDTDAGDENNLYVNNLSIIPEPDMALLFLSGIGLIAYLRRRK